MRGAELADFAMAPYAAAAVRLRGWDDAAKDPAADVPGFGYYEPLLHELLR